MKLLDQVRAQIRVRHYAYSTEKSYCHWIKKYILFNQKQHPKLLTPDHVAVFLTHLAVREKVSASTQNQALCALIFLYRHVLGIEIGDVGGFHFSRQPKRLPTGLSKTEVKSLISNMTGVYKTIATLLYGAGLRQNEALRLRVTDINFERHELIIRNGKGSKDRITMLPEKCIEPLKESIENSRKLFDLDMEMGFDYIWLPNALNKKFPNSGKEFRWRFVFSSNKFLVTLKMGKEDDIIYILKVFNARYQVQSKEPV
ncbi:MAG: phage integrase N-terminal SAM-like domain-containing protein [Agarilytica sp.]